jgi:hypothetical protein
MTINNLKDGVLLKVAVQSGEKLRWAYYDAMSTSPIW